MPIIFGVAAVQNDVRIDMQIMTEHHKNIEESHELVHNLEEKTDTN